MSAAHISGHSSIAPRLVLAWVRFYTRDVEPGVARARRAELESDVWEQIHDPDGPSSRGSGFLIWRASRSVPADLAWRVSALRGTDGESRSLFARWEHGGLNAVLLTEGLVVTGLLAAVVVHVLRGGNAGVLGAELPATIALLGLALGAALTGFWLLLWQSTRWGGSVLVGAASIALLVVGGHAMVQISTTAAAIYYSTPFMGGHPGWSDVLFAAIVILCLFHGSVAVSWMPASGRRTSRRAGR